MLHSDMSIGSTPAVCAASTASGTPSSLHTAPIAFMSCTTPVTFDPWFTMMSLVFCLTACRMSSGSRYPSESGPTNVASDPCLTLW